MTNEDAKSFYEKMNRAREELLTLDWKDDKFLSLGGRNGYNYLSIDKIKRNIAPVLQRNRIELGIDYENLNMISDPKGVVQHWTVRLEASLVDVDTGYERRYSAFGESADHGDKGVNKAQTAAMKQFLSNVFLLIDGIDPDATGGESTGSFSPKTPNEVLVAKSKILANAVKPSISPLPEKAPTVPKAEEPKAEEPKAEEPKAEEPKAEEPKAEEPKAEEPKAESVGNITPMLPDFKELKVTAPQRNAISKIVEARTKMAMDGKISPAEYNEMSADYAGIMNQAGGSAFISKYRLVSL